MSTFKPNQVSTVHQIWVMVSIGMFSCIISSCDPNNMNSIAADRVGGNKSTVGKVVAGATDFMILDLQKTSSKSTVVFNKKFAKSIGFIQIEIHDDKTCTGSSQISAIKLIDDSKKELDVSKLNLNKAFLCAWEVSENEKIKNAASNTGLDLSLAAKLNFTPPPPYNGSVSKIFQNSMRINWSSAGSSTNDYIIKCQSGTTAPTDSTGGTVVTDVYYDYAGLTASTAYVCSIWSRNSNSPVDLSSTYLVVPGTTLALPTVSITSPAASSYVNNATKAAFTVSGACSEEGVTVTISGAGSGTTTCTSGAWSKTLDVSGASDGNITIYADLSSASGSAATQTSRVFIKDIVAPPTLTTFTATTHATIVAANSLSLTLPGTTTDYSSIKTYRSTQSLTTGTTAPACGSGTLVNTTTNFASSPVTFNDTGLNQNSYYAYRVCIYDAAGNLENSKTVVDVRAKSFAWNVWYSAADADGDGNVSTGDISGSSSASWVDKSGNARNVTLTNFNFDGTTSGWMGTGTVANPYRLKCDGVNDYLTITASISNRTYAFWVRKENTNPDTLFTKFNGTTGLVFLANGLNQIFYKNQSSSSVYTPYTVGRWQHIVITTDSVNGTYYQDGVYLGTYLSDVESSGTLNICAHYSAGAYSNASVGEFMASSASFTEADVRNLYESTRATYFTAPSVPTMERMYPLQGTASGGTTIKVTGYLLSTTTGVTVGGVAATGLTITSDNFISFVTPAGSAGYQDVVISNTLGNMTLTGGFNYYDTIAAPTHFFDAANIDGKGARGPTSSSSVWVGQKSSPLTDTKLMNFDFDGVTSGWLGAGSVANPYRLKFDGVNDYASFQSASPKLYSVWFKPNTILGTSQAIIGNTGGHTNVQVIQNAIMMYYDGLSASALYQPAIPNIWYNAIIHYDGTNANYYINGLLVKSLAASQESTNMYYLGQYGNGSYYFNGSVAEVMTSSSLLTEADVRKIYENTRTRYQTPPASPTIERVFPNSGPTAGGTTIRISGWNLAGTSSVTIGGTSASFTQVSPGALTVTTPVGTSGYKDIVITATGGTVTATGSFNYMNPPAGVMVWLDAGNIDSLGSKGSSNTSLQWASQTGAAYDAALWNFNFDGVTGWAGTGITSDPYRLKFSSSSIPKLVIPYGQGPRSYSFWFRAESGVTTTQYIHTKQATSSGFTLTISGGNLNYQWPGAASAFTTAISNNTWYHAVAVYDGTSVSTYYLNNVSVGSHSSGLTAESVTSKPTIGILDNNQFPLSGSIAEIHTFSTSLSGADVTTIWNMTKAKYGY